MAKQHVLRCNRCGLTEFYATKLAYQKAKEWRKTPWKIGEKRPIYKCGPNCDLVPIQYVNKKGNICVALKRKQLVDKEIAELKAKLAEEKTSKDLDPKTEVNQVINQIIQEKSVQEQTSQEGEEARGDIS